MSTTARPILFSGPMVRALLSGSKSQTRRIVKPQPEWAQDGVMYWKGVAGMIHSHRCPYGRPGDLLWVRETWAMHPYSLDSDPEPVCVYRATDAGPPAYNRWRPSIHMPRWASRLTLRITDVRVERLQAISEADAIAEGFPAVSLWDLDCASTPPSHHFRELWNSINGPAAWDANPFVWAITFDVIHANVDSALEAQP